MHNITIAVALDPAAIAVECESRSDISTKKHEAVEAFLMMRRSEEEVALLQDEAKNLVRFYIDKKDVIMRELQVRSLESDKYNVGAKSILHQLLINVNHLLEQGQKASTIINAGLEVPDDVICDSSDCSSDDDSECDDWSSHDVDVDVELWLVLRFFVYVVTLWSRCWTWL